MGISLEQTLDCFRSDDLIGIGMEADAVRRRLHPEGVVGYALEARLDCTRLSPGETQDDLYAAIEEAHDQGITSIHLQTATTPVEALLRDVRKRFPTVWLQALSPLQVHSLAAELHLSLRDTLARLIDAGLNSLADDGFRLADAPTLSEWLEVHRAAHSLGISTVAAMIFGAGEAPEQRASFLQAVHQLQHETNGFAAFAAIPATTPGGRELDEVTAVERLKTLAISRMYLDNIDTVQAVGTGQGVKVLQTSLRFGANDAGTISSSPGGEEDIRRIIRDAGFQPAHREMGYRAMLLA